MFGTVPVVDDISGHSRLLESLLAPDRHVLSPAHDGDESIRAVHDALPDLVPIDAASGRISTSPSREMGFGKRSIRSVANCSDHE
jgi:CheY-like chemotaxis protein